MLELNYEKKIKNTTVGFVPTTIIPYLYLIFWVTFFILLLK